VGVYLKFFKMENKRVLVIGGTGYIGESLVKKLISSKYDLTLLVRRKYLINTNKNCKYLLSDMLNKESLLEKIKDFDVVIVLASLIKSINKKKYIENSIGIKNIIDVLNKNNINKIIYFSSQNVLLKNKGPYAKSKEKSEGIIKNSNIQYVIIRPNYVYGIDKNNLFYKLSFLIKYFRTVIIIGNGNNKIQPIFKDDLSEITIKLLKNFKDFKNSAINVSGNKSLSLNEIIALIEKNLRLKSLKLHLPPKLFYLFKSIIPFDIEGIDESRTINTYFKKHNFSSLESNIKKITSLF